MRLPRPHVTKTLVVVLCVGLAFSAVGPVLMANVGDGRDYRAVEFDPATEPDVLADASNDVFHTGQWPEDEMDDELVDDAIADGPHTLTEPPRGITRLAEKRYAVHDGSYYRVDGRVEESDDSERVELDLERTSPESVVDDLAARYETVDPDVQRVVEDGDGTTGIDAPSVVERNGRYYAVKQRLGTVLVEMVSYFVGGTLARVGHAYFGTALGVLGATAIAGRRRALDRRAALIAAAAAVPVHVAFVSTRTSAHGHGFGGLLTAGPVLALALVVGVGTAIRSPRRSRDLALTTGLVLAASVLGAASLVGSDGLPVVSVLTTSLSTVVVVGVFGGPLALLGYVHTRSPDSAASAGDDDQ